MSRGYVIIHARDRAGGLYISGVDFGCFSTLFGQCEGLREREEQLTFTLFCVYDEMAKKAYLTEMDREWIGLEPETARGRKTLKESYYDVRNANEMRMREITK